MKTIQKGDKVQVIAGGSKGTVSVVEKVVEDKVIVKGVNIVKKAVKKEGFKEIIKPIHVSNVMIYCEKCKKPVKVGVKADAQKAKKGSTANVVKYRYCKKCESKIEKK